VGKALGNVKASTKTVVASRKESLWVLNFIKKTGENFFFYFQKMKE
jgi:hypothetical protein